MESTVKWAGGLTFIGTSGTGHSIVFGNPHDGGPRPGPSPMELMLIGAGGCSTYDVVSILKKGRQRIEDCVVTLSGERAETDPKVFVKVHMDFTVSGRALDAKKVERAISLSVEKYCSASAILAATAELSHGFSIVDTSA